MSRYGRFAALGALASLGAALLATPVTSSAAPGSPARITVVLRAPHPHALGRLARNHSLSHAARVARLRHLVPSEATMSAVTRGLASQGLRVTGETAWTVAATGSSVGPLAGLRARLAPYVSLVLPTTTATPAFQQMGTPVDGRGFRDAYTAPTVKPPGTGGTSDGSSTIATVQLSNYHSGDLSTYAKKMHLPQIVGTSRYHPVTVDGGPGSDTSGDIEVDLDQESILSTAPSARQRPYFAPNSSAGFVDAFSNAFDDVVQNKHENGHGDPHIVALSTSWGGCEANSAGQIGAMQTVIKSLAAAGVTVFASSGDDGIYDCRDSTGTGLGNSSAGVDYPASSPQVIGVGGTNLSSKAAKVTPNTGHNWRETAWSCGGPSACEGNGLLPILPQGTGGTGGGESGLPAKLLSKSPFGGFPEPAYQRRALRGSAIFGHQAHRLVPDIAADGDPQTGFALYSSDSSLASFKNSKGLVTVGGTSLSSPLSAALFTNTLAAAGVHAGIGDIHGALYRAYRIAPHKVFRDVTKGTNGNAANRGRDPSVTAHPGYDTLSGLGAVLWPALTPYLHLRGHHT